MKPIEFKEQNKVYAKNQPEYLPLPAYEDTAQGGRVISCWQLTWSERLKVLLTGKIWDYRLNFGKPIQPTKLLIDSPFGKTYNVSNRLIAGNPGQTATVRKSR